MGDEYSIRIPPPSYPPPFDPPSTQWIENWTGKGHSRLSSKRRISVSIHESTEIPLKEVHVLLNCLFLATLSAIKSQEKVNFAKRGTFIKKNRVNFKATPSFERKFGLIQWSHKQVPLSKILHQGLILVKIRFTQYSSTLIHIIENSLFEGHAKDPAGSTRQTPNWKQSRKRSYKESYTR